MRLQASIAASVKGEPHLVERPIKEAKALAHSGPGGSVTSLVRSGGEKRIKEGSVIRTKRLTSGRVGEGNRALIISQSFWLVLLRRVAGK